MTVDLAGYTLGEVIERDGFVCRQRATIEDERGIAREVVITRPATPPSAPIDGVVETCALASARISRGVVPIRAVGRDAGGQPFVVSAPIGGTRLSERLERGPIERREMLWLALDVARTLAAAHALEPALVHGGLRPSAIVIDAEGFARLDDYGLGAALGSVAQADSAVLEHTARFSSPEHTNGTAPLPASDRFALASVIFEALTGRAAFEADSAVGALMKISMGRPRVGADARVGPELQALLAACWSKDPDKRIGAAALVLGLEALAGAVDPRLPPPKPIPAPAPSPKITLDDDEPCSFEMPTLRSVEIPNHVDRTADIPEKTVMLSAMPLPPPSLSPPHHRPRAIAAPVLEELATMRGETMAIAEILATAGRPALAVYEDEASIDHTPIAHIEPDVMEWPLLWTLVAMGAAVTMLLLTIFVVIASA